MEKVLVGNISYKLTEQDKVEIAEKVKESFPSESWEFTLQNGEKVTKEVCVK